MPATASIEHPRQESLDAIDDFSQVNSDYLVPFSVRRWRNWQR
jgi:hypothetical protein